MNIKSPPVTASLGFGITPKARNSNAKGERGPPPAPDRKARILIVDPDPESRRFMIARLTAAEYAVEYTDRAALALDACVRVRPNLVITDLRLDSMDGLNLLKELKSRWPTVEVIIVTAHATIDEAVRATQYGAFGFLVKPVEKAELLGQVERAIAASTFASTAGKWRVDIIARSQLMEDRLDTANRAAASDEPVLLTGQNGTGKELLARAIHAASPRRDQAFVAVRCEDVAEEALEAALFGGENFAGALKEARGGTLLIDDIGCLPPRLQTRLVASLHRPGIRLISSSSRDLKELMDCGQFRQDLYYLASVLPIEIPPLGRRREDIPLLVSHFLEQATEAGGIKKIYTPDAIELLATTDWPGNVRQLFELVKKHVALSHGNVMSREFVQRSLGEDAGKVPTYDEARDTFAHDYLTLSLASTAGNISESARLAKRNRTDFYKLLARHRVTPEDFKNETTGPPKK